MPSVAVELARKVYKKLIEELSDLYNRAEAAKKRKTHYEAVKNDFISKLQEIPEQGETHISREVLRLYTITNKLTFLQELKTFANTFRNSNISILDTTGDANLQKIDEEISEEEDEETDEESIDNMALPLDEVEKRVLRHCAQIYKGETELKRSFIDSLEILRMGIDHANNQPHLLLLIKSRIGGNVRDWIDNCQSVLEVINVINNRIKSTPISELETKLKLTTFRGDKQKFTSEIENLSKQLEAAYISNGMPMQLAQSQTISKTVEVVKNAIPTEVGKNALLGKFDSISEVLTRFRERNENHEAAINVAIVNRNRHNFRHFNNRGNRGNNFRNGGFNNRNNFNDSNRNNNRNYNNENPNFNRTNNRNNQNFNHNNNNQNNNFNNNRNNNNNNNFSNRGQNHGYNNRSNNYNNANRNVRFTEIENNGNLNANLEAPLGYRQSQ